MLSGSSPGRNDGVLRLSPPTGSAGPWSMGHVSLPDILDFKLGGLIILLKIGSFCILFNLESQVNVTLELLPLGLEVHDGIQGEDSKREQCKFHGLLGHQRI